MIQDEYYKVPLYPYNQVFKAATHNFLGNAQIRFMVARANTGWIVLSIGWCLHLECEVSTAVGPVHMQVNARMIVSIININNGILNESTHGYQNCNTTLIHIHIWWIYQGVRMFVYPSYYLGQHHYEPYRYQDNFTSVKVLTCYVHPNGMKNKNTINDLLKKKILFHHWSQLRVQPLRQHNSFAMRLKAPINRRVMFWLGGVYFA